MGWSQDLTTLEKKKKTEILKEVYEEHKDKGDQWVLDRASHLWTRWKCQTDLYFLGSVVLGLENARDRKTRRKRLDPKIHKPLAKALENNRDVMCLYPRLHLKTFWMKCAVIQRVIQDPYNRCGIWSKTVALARKELKSIKQFLLKKEMRELFPDIIPDRKAWEKDTADELTMFRDPIEYMPQENQIEVWGVEGTVTGHHYDYHFYDDVIDKDNVTTPEQIEKVITWWELVQAIRDFSAIEKITGTRYHRRDIYGYIMKEGFFEKKDIMVRKARVAGKPWYSFFTKKKLAEMESRMGSYNWSCQMMNEPVPPADRLFVPPYPVYNELPEKRRWYMTVDPASRVSKEANFSGFSIACVDPDIHDKVFYKEAFKVKLPPNELADLILAKLIQYRPVRVGIEWGVQIGIKWILDLKIKDWEEAQKEKIRPIFIDISTGKTRKTDKLNYTIGAFVRSEKALFAPDLKELFLQMDLYNPHSEDNEDDILDATGMMIQTIEYFAQSRWFQGPPEEEVEGYTLESLFKKPVTNRWGERFIA
jgi:hypothetical protein